MRRLALLVLGSLGMACAATPPSAGAGGAPVADNSDSVSLKAGNPAQGASRSEPPLAASSAAPAVGAATSGAAEDASSQGNATGAGSAPAATSAASDTRTTPVPPGMLPVPGGEFVLGADDEGEQDERPKHKATVKSFLLDTTEVTNRDYLECVRASVCGGYDSLEDSRLTNGKPAEFHKPDHPAVGVAWSDAKAYCEWRGKRLPTEAEWERAARGADGRRFVWGNEPPDPKKHGAFGGRLTTEPVGMFPDGKGPYGHLDLAGNVWEWVSDEYDPFAYQRPTAPEGVPGTCAQILETQDYLRAQKMQGYTGSNPIPTECEHVLRGGAYNYPVKGLRASNRVHHPGRFRIAVAGFRCAK